MTQNFDRLICLTTFLLTMAIESSQATSTPHVAFDEFVEQQVEVHKVAGGAIAIIEQGTITHESAFGLRSTETSAPVSPDTVFQAASISKAVTAWGVMRLVQEGHVELDAPVSKYLTRWHLPPSPFDEDEVTIRRVLSHTAGLSLPSYVGFDPAASLPTFEASLSGDTAGSGSLELVAIPGDGWAYSGGGYTLLGLIIEEVTGQTFAAYMEEHILRPLGMANSSYLPDEGLLSRTAQAHDFYLNTIPNYRLAAQSAGSLHTTARDLARFAIANMNDNPVLTRETLNEMHTPIIDTGFGSEMSLGFFVEGEGQLIGHSGSNRGWKARVQFSPASNVGLVVLTNSESGEALVSDTFCRWNDVFEIGLLTTRCAQQNEQQSLLESIGWLSTILISSVALALALRLLSNVLLNRRILARPAANEWRCWALALALLITTAHCLFLYSGLGVWIVAGIPWGFSIADHAPNSIRYAFHALLGLYALIAASLLMLPRERQ
ncbi:serine hydrolase [Parvibaculaceae bacterium PLY_AMNH_Bact1]|nr:serine hydrolase [Parvibaculaceae bacterium PLY_AMNH_Bact1]